MSDQASAKDNEHVEKALKIVLDNTTMQYKLMATDLPNFQMSYLKTYLWLSTVLIAAEASVFNSLGGGAFAVTLFKNPVASPFYAFATLALIAALFCFVFGVDSMRGRFQSFLPFSAVGDWLRYANDTGHQPNLPVSTHTAALEALDKAIVNHKTEIQWLGAKLKKMSLTLLSSVVLALCAICAHAWT